MPYSPAYLEGVRLFNAGHFWHAHEQWEACWLAADEPEATFYKGIIQAAAALVKWQQGNPRGVQLNWAKSRPKLLRSPDPLLGLHIAAFVAAMDAFVTAYVAGNEQQLPRITLLTSSDFVA